MRWDREIFNGSDGTHFYQWIGLREKKSIGHQCGFSLVNVGFPCNQFCRIRDAIYPSGRGKIFEHIGG
jgi:hypothetical protein